MASTGGNVKISFDLEAGPRRLYRRPVEERHAFPEPAADEPIICTTFSGAPAVALPEDVQPRALMAPDQAIRLGLELVRLGELLEQAEDAATDRAHEKLRPQFADGARWRDAVAIMSGVLTRIRLARYRKEAAEAYAAAMFHCADLPGIWEPINLAIVDRWSESGLKFVKELAWELERAAQTSSLNLNNVYKVELIEEADRG